MEKGKELYWKYSLVGIILLMGVIIFIRLVPFLGGLLGALTIYLLMRGQMQKMTLKWKFRRWLAAVLILMETILCFLVPLALVVWLVVDKVQHINLDPQSFIRSAEQLSELVREKINYDLLKIENIESAIAVLPRIGQNLMEGISKLIVNIFVMIIVLYFMLIGGTKMERYVSQMLPFSVANKNKILQGMNKIVKSNAIGIPLLAFIQGAIAMGGYYLFQAPSPLLLGFLTCFASVIPIVGTSFVWGPAVVYLLLTGDWGNALGLVAYAGLVIIQVDNLIRFILQKKIANTHPLITIFGVVIGLPLFGFMGIIFGPLLLSLFLLCVDIFKEEYLRS